MASVVPAADALRDDVAEATVLWFALTGQAPAPDLDADDLASESHRQVLRVIQRVASWGVLTPRVVASELHAAGELRRGTRDRLMELVGLAQESRGRSEDVPELVKRIRKLAALRRRRDELTADIERVAS